MKILIIGSEGFIGKNSVAYFQQSGHDVWQAGITDLQKDGYTLLNEENTDFEILFKTNRYDVCINASGSAHVGFSFENPIKDFELNVLNINKLLIAIRKYNPTCKFINFSSAAVYGNPTTLPISENAPTNPLSPYGFHKLQSELILKEYHKFFGLHTCSLRVFSAYGVGLKKQLFWDLYQKALQSRQVALFGTGEESRDFIHIADLLSALDKIIKNANFEGEVINVASGKEITINEAVTTFYRLFDEKINFEFTNKLKVGDPNNWCADIRKLKEIGFSPQYSLEAGLKKYIQWLKEKE